MLSTHNIVEVLENELACVRRQDTPECIRNQGESCEKCDLVLPAEVVEDAYVSAIKLVKESELTDEDWK